MWTRLQDIHEAFGLRHQWGGSHCNKVLLSCLGIDTRNIVSPGVAEGSDPLETEDDRCSVNLRFLPLQLFTGQKKQPVIVPMYAASLVSRAALCPLSRAGSEPMG